MHGKSYRNLAIELIVHFMIMYLVMYTMIAAFDHFYFNLNNVYMTLMMVTPMALLMLVLMRSMYGNKRANLIIAIGAVASSLAASTRCAAKRRSATRSSFEA